MPEHPGVTRARQYVDLFHRGDFEAMRHFYADDVVWHVGGKHVLSGAYRGVDALFAYFAEVRRLTRGSLRLNPESILASRAHTAMFTRVTGRREGRVLDVKLVEILRSDADGRWAEYWGTADDPEAVAAFWL